MERKGGCVREVGQEQERKTSQFTSRADTNKTSLIHTATPTEASPPTPPRGSQTWRNNCPALTKGHVGSAAERKEGPASVCPTLHISKHCGFSRGAKDIFNFYNED